MKARSNMVVRIKLIVLLTFVCLLAAAIWRVDQFAERTANAQVTPPPANTSATPAAAPAPTVAPAAQPEAPKVEGCLKCHGNIEPMHRYNATGDALDKLVDGKDAQGLTCTSCHGGNPATIIKKDAHVQPRYPKEWGCKQNGDCSSRNPERTNTLIAKESNAFVRFVNPGDFRVIGQSCGECHADQNRNVSQGMMAHGSMLWGAALYNNGGLNLKDAQFGESYNEAGNPQALIQSPAPTREQQAFKGYLTWLNPLPRWELSQPGNILRVFERGGKRRLRGWSSRQRRRGREAGQGTQPTRARYQ